MSSRACSTAAVRTLPRPASETGSASRRSRPVRSPSPPGAFDVVFSKDAIVHIHDKASIMREAFRVLRPGGWLVASDWLIGHDGPPSPEMAAYIAAEGLDFGMASPTRYAAALTDAGFEAIEIRSRNAWYRDLRGESPRTSRDGSARPPPPGRRRLRRRRRCAWAEMLPVLEFGRALPDASARPQAAHRRPMSPSASKRSGKKAAAQV